MDPVSVIVIGDKHDPYCRSCAHGRTMDAITHSLTKQLDRRFGDAVRCRFVDVRDLDAEGLAFVKPDVQRGSAHLPIILINKTVRYRGLFSPTFIQRDIQKLLQRRKPGADPESTRPTLSREQLRRLRLRQLFYASNAERHFHRLSHIPADDRR